MSVVSMSKIKKLYRDRMFPKLINGCGHKIFIEHNCCLVCKNCGYVVEERRFRLVSKRAYSYDEVLERSHTNIIELKFNENRTTFNVEDVRGTLNYGKFNKLKKKDTWTNNRKYPRMMETKVNISQCIKSLGFEDNRVLSSHVDYILQKTGNYNLQGKSIKLYAAAILVYCLRLLGISEKVKHIFSFYGIRKKMSLFNTMGELIRIYKLKQVDRPSLYTNVTRYLNELIGKYNIDVNSVDLITVSEEYSNVLENCGGGNSTTCNTAGIIYFLFKKYRLRPTQKQIADHIKVSTVSLRSAYNILLEYETNYGY